MATRKKTGPRKKDPITGKGPGGAPTKYRPEYCQEIIRFFDVPAIKTVNGREVANDLPFFESFAREIDVSVETLDQWQDVHAEFSEAYKKAKKKQEENWKICSLKGLYNPAFTIFFGKNIYHWRDKQELEHSGELGIRNLEAALDAAEDAMSVVPSQDGRCKNQ